MNSKITAILEFFDCLRTKQSTRPVTAVHVEKKNISVAFRLRSLRRIRRPWAQILTDATTDVLLHRPILPMSLAPNRQVVVSEMYLYNQMMFYYGAQGS